MDSFELFRKLGAGAKFDLKRFGQDATRFKVNVEYLFVETWKNIAVDSDTLQCILANPDFY